MSLPATGILTPWRLKWYPRVLLAAAALAFLLTLGTGQGGRIATGRLGGDFPEFYGAGRVVAEGKASELYNEKVQRLAQADLLPDEGPEGFIPFAYPPQVALYYSLLARLPYRAAFILQTALSALFLLLAARLLREGWPRPSRHVLAVFTAMVFFYPLLRALFGGQNTPLTLLCLAAAHALYLREREFTAGVFLGVLLYKPQFGLVFLGLYALAGRWRVLLGGVVTAVAAVTASTVIFGPDWSKNWFSFARLVIDSSMAVESEKAVSFIGVLRNVAIRTGVDVAWVGYVLALAASVPLAMTWFGSERAKKPRTKEGAKLFCQRQMELFGLASAGALLIAPHAYYYDVGLLLPAFMAYARSGSPRRMAVLLVAWALGFSQLLAGALGVSPLFFLSLGAYCTMLTLLWSRRKINEVMLNE